MLAHLWLPTVLTAVGLFFNSFLSWMVLHLHWGDWRKLDHEDEFLDTLRAQAVPSGNFMFPGCRGREEMDTPEFKARMEAGPRGVMTVFVPTGMGRNLALTFAMYLAVTAVIAALGWTVLPAGAGFVAVFRFFSVVAGLAYLTAIVQHSIWFQCRIVGHLIESLACAAITGAIFGALWPAA